MDNIVTPLSCILSGHLQQRFGPRKILMLTCFAYVLAWICAFLSGYFEWIVLLYISRYTFQFHRKVYLINIYLTFLQRLIVGVSQGFLSTTIYIVEVVSKELRGSFAIFEGVTTSAGYILAYGLGALMPWHLISAVGGSIPILAFLLLVNSPESPSFLVSKGREKNAEKSIMKLSMKSGEDAALEVKTMKKSLDNSSSQESSWIAAKKIIEQPQFYKPFLIVSLLRNDFFSSKILDALTF